MNTSCVLKCTIEWWKKENWKESKKEQKKKKKTRSLKSLEKRNGITQTVGSDKNMLTL